MSGVNKVILLGNLGKDPEVRALDNGVKVANFSLATSKSYKDRNTGEKIDKVDWHNIVLWRGIAEVAEKYLKKGSQVYLEGELQTETYEDKEGNTRYKTNVVCNVLNMLGKADSANSAPSTPEPSVAGGVTDDDLPW